MQPNLTPALELLNTKFGYPDFRPGQEEVIGAIQSGENVLAVMPTGSGKSLCYQIPALLSDGLTLVVSPLVALMEDQVAALKINGVLTEALNSSRNRDANVDIWKRVAAGEVKILYIAPERLMTDRMLAALQKLPISQITIDEAHCISRWGPSFRPDYEDLTRLSELFPGIPISAFTATADAATRQDISEKLFNGPSRTFVTGYNRPNIQLSVEPRRDWKHQLLDFVKARPEESGIVYCLSRKKTEETAAFLSAEGFQALPYHAGMDASERTAHQDIFKNESGVIMTATIAFGMGIDKPDVRFVFHANLPGNMEAYYQELGRAGRDGEPAEAFMLYGLDDIRQRRQFIQEDDVDDDHKRREHKRLDALVAYCETPECRRKALLAYFGEESEACGNCDVCLDPPVLEDGTELAGWAMTAIRETGQRFGTSHIIDVLRGAETEKIRKFGHDRLSVHGAGAAEDKRSWGSILRQMVASGYLHLDISGYGGLSVTETGEDLLHDGGEFQYRRETLRPKNAQATARPETMLGELSGDDQALFATLKRLRLHFAKERGVPAYAIFRDRSLAEMAKYRPATEEEFGQIYGVGAAKLEAYSEPFLAKISRAD